MAQYKVPQDVEAEDRLLGPLTFRQFVYLMIGIGCGAACWGLGQLFLPLAIIPLPFCIFFIILALPLRKDQPMETYLAAVLSFHLNPTRRLWTAGQRESTILITAPKKKEVSRVRDITEDEASHRLSFLANLVDTEGQSIRGIAAQSSMKEEYVAEAASIDDILETKNDNIDRIIAEEQAERHAELVANMRYAVQNADSIMQTPAPNSTAPSTMSHAVRASLERQKENLANNTEYSVQTIAAEANRISPQSAPQPVIRPVESVTPQESYKSIARRALDNYEPGQAIYSPGGNN